MSTMIGHIGEGKRNTTLSSYDSTESTITRKNMASSFSMMKYESLYAGVTAKFKCSCTFPVTVCNSLPPTQVEQLVSSKTHPL
jgi:hypothetical protein